MFRSGGGMAIEKRERKKFKKQKNMKI